MKHIKVGVQNDRLFVESRFMYIAIVIDVLVKKNVSIIDNVTCREVFFSCFFVCTVQISSEHRRVGTQNVCLDDKKLSMHI